MTSPKSILELVKFEENKLINVLEKRHLYGIMWQHYLAGAQIRDEYLMPVIEAQEARIAELRSALQVVRSLSDDYGNLFITERIDKALAADDQRLKDILEGAK